MIYSNAQQAFESLYHQISRWGESTATTKRLLNVGFTILDSQDKLIETPWRNWSHAYAKREMEWYLSKNRSVAELKKFAPIWDTMHKGDDIVNSNYGYLWSRNEQLEKTITQLRENPNTRQAWITLFDGKEKDDYEKDTPCTLNIGFTITKGAVNITVLMRSNDLWYGFCNDQYCFAELHKMVAESLGLEIGWYYHFAADLHLYNDFLDKNIF